MTFQKILVANRGEIAARVIKTCKKMGIQTIAVYSEADAELSYVKEADEARLIGAPPVSESYLNMEVILSVAKELGADAIHPGYGLLSENEKFAKRCEEEGICFIGPTSEVMQSMGSKIEARRTMEAAGVPVVPGYDGEIADVAEALKIADDIGYPIMLKASAGGGGIGMSFIASPEELEKVFTSVKTRAENYFGDSKVYIEKYLENPRHIEVQIAADGHGNVVHLFERECSVQRRNQKVIEESPSPLLTDSQRESLFAAAIQGAKAIGYKNLGTMEFIFDEHGQFYFLEMNTRLQVEHPVTESITNFDLVEWQIRIAQGEKLPAMQSDIHRTGHAIELRIYAEDPVRFFPSPGKITKLTWPGDDVRIDTAVHEGAQITPFYDPMIAKVIVHGNDRTEAIKKAQQALSETTVEGIKSNVAMLLEVLEYEDFQTGNYSTKVVEKMRSEQ